jgi:hypothetical protein
MTNRAPPKPASYAPRKDRLGGALRENLKRRKAQAKGRALEAEPETPPAAPQAPNSAGFPNHKRKGNA